MSRFARLHRTIFFEEPLFDEDSSHAWLETRIEQHQLLICTPHVPHGTSDERVLELQRKLLDDFIETQRIDPRVLWFYTPMALQYARHLDGSVVVYDCMDELSAFLNAPAELRALESELLDRADLVFTGGQSLYEAKRDLHPSVHAFPSSVDAEHFAKARSATSEPADQASIPPPLLGFFGVIDERLDLTLLAMIADERPDWQLVLLGPVVKIDPSSLPQRPNIHWLGQKSYDELPSYLAGWNVALIPFALNASTRFISPTKTLEYMAAGKPIVSSAIHDVVRPYGEAGVVAIADHDTFVRAIEKALRSRDDRAEQIAADAIVAATSWDRTWRKMNDLIVRRASTETQPLQIQSYEEREHV